MKVRRGVSLVELLVAMTSLAVILTLSTGLIHRIMLAQMRSRAGVDAERTALRLAGTFRRDVWQAESAMTSGVEFGSEMLVRLSLPNDQVVEYRLEDAAVARLLRYGERTAGRDRFALPEGAAARVVRESESLLLLTVVRPPVSRATPQKSAPLDAFAPNFALQVRARVGRDAAFEHSETDAEAAP
jgi:hypothetical protein